MSGLTIDMTEQQHRDTQAMAALRGQTIGQYAIERLFPDGGGGEEEAWCELKALLTRRVEDGLAGKVSPRSFQAIVDDEPGPESQA